MFQLRFALHLDAGDPPSAGPGLNHHTDIYVNVYQEIEAGVLLWRPEREDYFRGGA